MTKSEKLFERSKKVSPGGVHSPVRGFRGVGGFPKFIESANRARLRDVDGREYIDFCQSWGPLIFGHQDPEISEAVKEALSRGWTYGAAEPYSLELAEFICSEIPWVEKVRFVNSGTEAVMSALRLARAATGRSSILKFDGCYHGHVDSMLVRAGSGLAEMASPDSAGVSKTVASETLVAPLNDVVALRECFASHGSALAAVILEPVPANNGLLPHTEAFIKEVVSLAKNAGALVVFDEVITGFRVGFRGMAEIVGVRPDLVTYGKVIGGGFPIGAFGGRADLMSMIAPEGPVYQAGTLSANPIAVAAGFATLKKLKRENPYSHLQKETEWLSRELESIVRKKGMAFQVQNFASIFWGVFGEVKTSDGVVRAVRDIPAIHREVYAGEFHRLLDRGIYLAPSAFEVGFLSTAHSRDDLEMFTEALR